MAMAPAGASARFEGRPLNSRAPMAHATVAALAVIGAQLAFNADPMAARAAIVGMCSS